MQEHLSCYSLAGQNNPPARGAGSWVVKMEAISKGMRLVLVVERCMLLGITVEP